MQNIIDPVHNIIDPVYNIIDPVYNIIDPVYDIIDPVYSIIDPVYNIIPALWRRGHSLTACNAAPPAKSEMAARGPQNGGRGLERCLP